MGDEGNDVEDVAVTWERRQQCGRGCDDVGGQAITYNVY